MAVCCVCGQCGTPPPPECQNRTLNVYSIGVFVFSLIPSLVEDKNKTVVEPKAASFKRTGRGRGRGRGCKAVDDVVDGTADAPAAESPPEDQIPPRFVDIREYMVRSSPPPVEPSSDPWAEVPSKLKDGILATG